MMAEHGDVRKPTVINEVLCRLPLCFELFWSVLRSLGFTQRGRYTIKSLSHI
jgi:hypothetical protein